MRVSTLQLTNYRNYEELKLSFPNTVNIFLGENAQGKTNLLESIYVLAMTRSHRTTNDKELIRWNQDFAKVVGKIEKRTNQFPLEILISSKGRKTKINHLEQKKLSDYIGQLNVILFAPEDLSIVKGSPSVRRKFLDMELGQVSPKYLYELVQYQQILKQRNQYLKQLAEGKSKDLLYLDILSEQLVASGCEVLVKRYQFLEKLEKWAAEIHHTISFQKENLTIGYKTSLAIDKTMSKEQIEAIFLETLKKNQKREKIQQTTLTGPHRDDLFFEINGHNVQNFGSQGQQRTTALSIKLAEIDLMKEETGEYPILLLDDVLSELDDFRQKHLLDAIQGKVQTFLTTTSLKQIEDQWTVEPDIFYVKKGTVERKRETI